MPMIKNYEDMYRRDIRKAELSDVSAYRSNDHWYLRLVFDYEDTNGDKYKMEIPKMELPLRQDRLPFLIESGLEFDEGGYICLQGCNVSGMLCSPMQRGTVTNIDDLFKNGDSYYLVIKRMTRQMTIEEIEKELGYKINIVDKH